MSQMIQKRDLRTVAKKAVTAAVLLTMLISLPASSRPATADAQVSNKIIITSQNLDEVLFANNQDVIHAMEAVISAKDRINMARASLVPSLNLNVVLAITNPPMFMANAVTCLVPFLFPANWFALRASRLEYGAEVMSFHITKLNVYSQADALATQVAGDTAVLRNMESHGERVQEYVRNLQLQADLGVMAQTEVTRGQMELGKMDMELSKLRQLINEERASIRRLFGFQLDQDFDFELAEMTPSRFETWTPMASLDYIVARAPERRQLDLLISGAQARVRAAGWAFLGGCQGNMGGFNSSSGSAFQLGAGFSVNLSAGAFVGRVVARHNRDALIRRQAELSLELGRVLEISIANIAEIAGRAESALSNETLSERMLTEQAQLLELGRVSVRDMLETYAIINAAKTESMAARSALDGHRITLKRVALEGGFMKVFIDSRNELEFGR